MSEPDASVLNVDPGRFTGEGADLSLLSWLRGADQALDTLAPDAILPHVDAIHKLVIRLLVPGPVSPATALPKPGRPVRHLVARVIVKLHGRVESRALFDLIQALLKGVDGGDKRMSPLENVQRVASWYTVGEVIKEHGSNVSTCWSRSQCSFTCQSTGPVPWHCLSTCALTLADDVVHGRDLYAVRQGAA